MPQVQKMKRGIVITQSTLFIHLTMKYTTLNYLPDKCRVLFSPESALDRKVCSVMLELCLVRPSAFGNEEVEAIIPNNQVEYNIANLQSQALATINFKKYLFPTTNKERSL